MRMRVKLHRVAAFALQLER